jgi:hypothetical protein
MAIVSQEREMLEAACDSVLDSISEVSTLCRESRNLGRDLPLRIDEVQNFIATSLRVENDDRINLLRSEILSEVPDIRFDDRVHISQSVSEYINERVAIKVRECARLTEDGRTAEKLLRRQLSEAVAKIQKLQSKTAETRQTGDLADRVSEWAVHKKKLDETMATLEVERTAAASYLRSPRSILDFDA